MGWDGSFAGGGGIEGEIDSEEERRESGGEGEKGSFKLRIECHVCGFIKVEDWNMRVSSTYVYSTLLLLFFYLILLYLVPPHLILSKCNITSKQAKYPPSPLFFISIPHHYISPVTITTLQDPNPQIYPAYTSSPSVFVCFFWVI